VFRLKPISPVTVPAVIKALAIFNFLRRTNRPFFGIMNKISYRGLHSRNPAVPPLGPFHSQYNTVRTGGTGSNPCRCCIGHRPATPGMPRAAENAEILPNNITVTDKRCVAPCNGSQHPDTPSDFRSLGQLPRFCATMHTTN